MNGTMGWLDLTVDDATTLKDFYGEVVGWEAQGVDMDGYQDFAMSPPGGDAVAGLCHARGSNAGLPPVWLPYFVVEDVVAAADAVAAGGGEVLQGPRSAGGGAMAVCRDPSGAPFAIWAAGA